jgi:hypothetical protein
MSLKIVEDANPHICISLANLIRVRRDNMGSCDKGFDWSVRRRFDPIHHTLDMKGKRSQTHVRHFFVVFCYPVKRSKNGCFSPPI